MSSMPMVLTEMENENDSVNQNYIAKMALQKWRCKNDLSVTMTSQTVLYFVQAFN